MKILKKHRILACILCLVFVATLFVSETYIVTHTHHDCIGEGCPVCAALASCEQLLKNLAANGPIPVFMGACALSYGCICLLSRAKENSAHTLITLKVKLSD